MLQLATITKIVMVNVRLGFEYLGLNIVHNLVMVKLNGALEFASSKGNGVRFNLSIPKQLENN